MLNRRLMSLALPALVCLAVPALGACGDSKDGAAATNAATANAGSGEKLDVAAAFYPLVHIVEKVGGDRVQVTSLTKPGGEAHDVELNPQDLGHLSDAKVVVYLKGFQPAVDEAVESNAKDRGFDVAGPGEVNRPAEAEAEEEHHDDAPATPGATETEAEHEHHDEHGHDHGGTDPHFWLDPVRYGKVVTAVGAKLGELDPVNKELYANNAKSMVDELTKLDEEFKAGTATCKSKKLVTAHQAFAYLADRYGFEQIGVAGLNAEEPDPARMAKVIDFIKTNQVRTVYTETLLPKDLADTIARDSGAKTAVLDPIEAITEDSAAKDYEGVMRANLQALRTGQECA